MRPPLAVLLLVSLLVTSGCLGFVDESRSPSDQQALDALNRSRTALDDVTSYRARSAGTAEGTSDDQQVRVAVSGEALVNVTARKIHATYRVDDRPRPTGKQTRQMYVTGYTAYTECRLAGWGRQNLSESRPWFEFTPIGEQLAVLDRAPVYWRGTEPLNGTETAVIVAHPTEQELQAAPNLLTVRAINPEEARFENATLTVWIDTETWRPLQVSREIRLQQKDVTVMLTATWQFDEYDVPAVVTRPSFDRSEVREHGC